MFSHSATFDLAIVRKQQIIVLFSEMPCSKFCSMTLCWKRLFTLTLPTIVWVSQMNLQHF